MSEISTSIIKEAVYKLCFEANTCLNTSVYSKLENAYNNAQTEETKSILKLILQNAKLAYETKKPLCQDTGQVIVFLELGQEVNLKGEYIEKAINDAIADCYRENYFRKSIAVNSIFDRNNTNTNTPAIIYTNIIEGDEIHIKVLVKGAGSENKSKLEMLLPTTNENDLIKKIGDAILSAKENSCPPMFIGIGSGFSADKAMFLSKKALTEETFTSEETELAEKIKEYVNSKAPEKYKDCYVLDIKLISAPTHIACLPVGISINCHSDRYSSCTIKNNKISYNHKVPDFIDFKSNTNNIKEVLAQDIKGIKELKEGERILLSGEIYVARDLAHKKLAKMIEHNEPLPFDIKNKIILYAGPCPARPNEISGSIGPTTSSRMDKYAVLLYKNGLLATIGKGDRNEEVQNIIKETGSKYFSLQGGIAALLSESITKSEIIAFHEFGTEGIYKINIDKIPVKVENA